MLFYLQRDLITVNIYLKRKFYNVQRNLKKKGNIVQIREKEIGIGTNKEIVIENHRENY